MATKWQRKRYYTKIENYIFIGDIEAWKNALFQSVYQGLSVESFTQPKRHPKC